MAADNPDVPAPPPLPSPAPPALENAPPIPYARQIGVISGASPQLSAEHLQQLAAARAAMRKISRAMAVARFDGGTIAFGAAITFMFSLGSISGMVIGAALGVIAFIELHSAARLKRLDPGSIRWLGLNQLALCGMLILYSLWSIYSELTGSGITGELKAVDPQLQQMMPGLDALARQMTLLVYGGVIVASLLAQGGMALYYFTRKKYLQTYLSQTPPWIVEMQKGGYFTL